jgi:hypothetical protein
MAIRYIALCAPNIYMATAVKRAEGSLNEIVPLFSEAF